MKTTFKVFSTCQTSFMVTIKPLVLELKTGAMGKLNKIAILSAIKYLTNQILEHSTMQDFFNYKIYDFSETWVLWLPWLGRHLVCHFVFHGLDNQSHKDTTRPKEEETNKVHWEWGVPSAFRKMGLLREDMDVQWLNTNGSHPIRPQTKAESSLSRKFRAWQWGHRKETDCSPVLTSTHSQGWDSSTIGFPPSLQYQTLELNSNRANKDRVGPRRHSH